MNTGQVKIRKTVTESHESVPVQLTSERVSVERTLVEQVFDVAQSPRKEGETFIVPVQEEILVVEKKFLVREEIRITTHRTLQKKIVTQTLRQERIEVERKDEET